ncbi:hypothetical protein PENSPDRAFT_651033 [Peniophora sp. CONT]|nr:hypothetical protein PENSPDRAFT_651033 [Peniophora sp. CONT]
MSRQPNPFPVRAQRDGERRVQRDGEPRSQRSDESRPQRTGEPRPQRDGETRAARYNSESRPQRDREPRAPRDGQRQVGQREGQRQTGPRDGERRARREGSLNDRVKQAGSDKINQSGAGGRERADNASADSTRERPAKTVHQAPPALRMSAFRTAQFGNVFSQPPADTPATREAEVLRALEVPKENNETLVVKPRKKDVRVEKGVRKVKKRIVMRGSKRVVVDPRIRPVLERYGGDYSRLAPRSAISALHKPKQPLAYARAALTLRPYLSKARREQALEVVEKFAREARAVA